MLLNKRKQSPLRKIAGGVCAAALVAAGLASTASYGYAADEDEDDKVVETTKTVTVHKSSDRVIVVEKDSEGSDDFDVRVMPSGDGEYEIFVDGDIAFFSNDDDEVRHIARFVRDSDHSPDLDFHAQSHCIADEGQTEPVKLEWTDEEGKDGDKHVTHSIICLTGDEAANPEKRAAALRKAIDNMEENAKKEEARRKRMIEGLRNQLREIEKK